LKALPNLTISILYSVFHQSLVFLVSLDTLKEKALLDFTMNLAEKNPITHKAFWSRGYFVRTIGLDQAMVEEYVRKQYEDDKYYDQNPKLELTWN